jgi:prepilin-type processing-associated H-X9-DG protein
MCPTFRKFSKRLGLEGCPNKAQHSRATTFSPNYSYSMNWFVGFDWWTYLDIGNEIMNQEISMKLSKIKQTAECFAFSEENLWTIGADVWDGGRGTKTYNAVILNDNALWLNANKNKPDGATDNIATYHKTPGGDINAGLANLVFVDGHVETMQGRPGREAYETYGRPYPGHDKVNIW